MELSDLSSGYHGDSFFYLQLFHNKAFADAQRDPVLTTSKEDLDDIGKPKPRSQWSAHLAMFLFSAFVSGAFSLGRLASTAEGAISPPAFNAIRFFISAVLVGVIGLLTKSFTKHWYAKPWRFIVLGTLFAIYLVTMFEGLRTSLPVSISAVFTTSPVMATTFGWFILRQTASIRILTALFIGAVGALWVIFRGDVEALLALQVGRGEIIYFWGCAAYAAFVPLTRLLNKGKGYLASTFGLLVAGFVVLTAYGFNDLVETDWKAVPIIVWIANIYTAVFSTVATFLFIQYATLRLKSSKVMAYTYLAPLFVVVWEVMLGHDPPKSKVLVGFVPVVVALVILFFDKS